MTRAICFGFSVLALSLTACERKVPEASHDLQVVAGEEPVPPPRTPPVVLVTPPFPSPRPGSAGIADGENDGSPDITPAPLRGEAAKNEKGARAVLLAWARGIELREFNQAWDLMGDVAKAQTSKAQFNALFGPLRGISVAVPGGQMEGAAGSSYYTVPATVTGTRADGSKASLKGDVVLRRVNDVDGATPAQLRWHIEQVNLRPA